MPHLTVAQFVLFFTAFALAAVRLLTASKPFWNATPFAKVLTIAGPAALAAFAAVPALLAQAKSWVDVAVALLTVASVAFAAAHGDKTKPADAQPVAKVERISFEKPPSGPDAAMSAAPALLAAFIAGSLIALTLPGCSLFKAEWPKIEACLQPSDATLAKIVAAVLSGSGDVEAELLPVAIDYGESAVECAVKEFVSNRQPLTDSDQHAVARGRAFLAKVSK